MVNGIGHYWGYRNYNSPDTSTNVFPWGIIIGGEELHNNHHAHGTSAKFSAKWYELDIGWGYISILKFFGLAKVKKVAPKLKLESGSKGIDLEHAARRDHAPLRSHGPLRRPGQARRA